MGDVKKTKWIQAMIETGCQICGRLFPEIKNNGLQSCHIVAKSQGGGSSLANTLILCPNGHLTIDVIIKPAIYNALKKHNDGRVPYQWKTGDGKRKKIDELIDWANKVAVQIGMDV